MPDVPTYEEWKDRAEKAEALIFAIAGGDAVLVNVADLNAVRMRAERAEAALSRAVAFGRERAEARIVRTITKTDNPRGGKSVVVEDA